MGIADYKTANQMEESFKKNDPVVLKHIYIKVYPQVRRFILDNSGSEAEAKDVYQEAFIACWQNVKDGTYKSGNLEAYLFTIAKNKWRDYLRSPVFKKNASISGYGHLNVMSDETDEEESIEKRRALLSKAFQKLGTACQQLLQAFYFERKSMEEIADERQITAASARNKKYRCMEQLRTLSLKNKLHE